MKTPDEIKKGLEQCALGECAGCPYIVMVDMPFGDEIGCNDDLMLDALAYIQQLERENANLKQVLREVKWHVEGLKTEWDAIKLDLRACVVRNKMVCHMCKNGGAEK